MDLTVNVNERVVLTTKNEVCYAGVATSLLTVAEKKGIMVQLDARSGLSVWCPEDFIKELLIIPIPPSSQRL